MRALVLAATMLALPAMAQDYAREKRWADEVVPAIVVGDAVTLKTTTGREFLAIYTPAANEKAALVILHGVGVHPDHGIIGVLRVRLADLGYSTLSIQLPVQKSDARADDYYPAVFPEALDRIGVAARWLQERGHRKLALVSHSMGSWMANEYFDATRDSPYTAWVCLGLTGGYSLETYLSKRPILDVYGEGDLDPVLAAAWRRRMTISTAAAPSRQAMVAGADHFYARSEAALATLIAGWLAEALPSP